MLHDLLAPPEPALQPEPGAALARKLDHHIRLTAEERAALHALLRRNLRRLDARTMLAEAGVPPGELQVIVEGWACRQVRLPDGRRRITAFHLPGDVCEFDVFLMTAMDQSIVALGPVRAAGINRAALNDLSRSQPRVSQGLWWESLTAAAVQRAWTVRVGQRSARARIAHLLCELYLRLSLVGLAADARAALPLTQADLGDACALTPVHTNRTLQELRAEGVIDLADQSLRIHDWHRLAAIGEFDPAYLQVKSLEPPAVATVQLLGDMV